MDNEKIRNEEMIEKIRKTVLDSIRENKMLNTVEISKTEFLTNKDGLDIYKVEEKIIGKDKVELFFVADENGNITNIGGRVEKTSNEIVPTQIGVDTLKEKNISFDVIKEEIERSIEEREKQIEALAKELGVTKEEISSLHEIDLEQKIEEEKEIDEEEKDEDEIKQDEKEENTISQKKMEKIGVKNEIDTNTVVDEKGKTLGEKTGLGEYTKICVVHSYKLNELTNDKGEKETRDNNLPYQFIGQKPDGSYEKIPENKLVKNKGLKQQKNNAFKYDGQIETRNDDLIFDAVGNEPSRLMIRLDDTYGKPKVYYGKISRDNDGIISEELPDNEKGTEIQNVEVRTIFNDNKGIDSIKDGKNELRQHPEEEKKGTKEADGDPNTGHIHFDPERPENKRAIERIVREGKIGEGSAKYYFIKKLEEKNNSKEEYNPETIADKIADEIIDDLNEQVHPQNRKQ